MGMREGGQAGGWAGKASRRPCRQTLDMKVDNVMLMGGQHVKWNEGKGGQAGMLADLAGKPGHLL